METWSFHSRDAEQTHERGVELGRSIGSRGLAIELIGPLGAGKTVFVKGLAEGLGVDPRVVSSPTFVIAQQYPVPEGPKVLHHVDLYRLESSLELESVGFFDMLGEGRVVAVEWADRFPGMLGREVLTIEFEGPSPEEAEAVREEAGWRGRRARVTARGEIAERVLRDWAERVEAKRGSAGGRAGATPEMRVMLILLLALGAAGFARFDGSVQAPSCEPVVELTADALGSLQATCGRSAEDAGPPLRGLGRILTGRGIDPNTASADLLQRLPAIGPVRAAAIAEARRAKPFSALRDLERVRGIGPRTRAALEPWLSQPLVAGTP